MQDFSHQQYEPIAKQVLAMCHCSRIVAPRLHANLTHLLFNVLQLSKPPATCSKSRGGECPVGVIEWSFKSDMVFCWSILWFLIFVSPKSLVMLKSMRKLNVHRNIISFDCHFSHFSLFSLFTLFLIFVGFSLCRPSWKLVVPSVDPSLLWRFSFSFAWASAWRGAIIKESTSFGSIASFWNHPRKCGILMHIGVIRIPHWLLLLLSIIINPLNQGEIEWENQGLILGNSGWRTTKPYVYIYIHTYILYIYIFVWINMWGWQVLISNKLCQCIGLKFVWISTCEVVGYLFGCSFLNDQLGIGNFCSNFSWNKLGAPKSSEVSYQKMTTGWEFSDSFPRSSNFSALEGHFWNLRRSLSHWVAIRLEVLEVFGLKLVITWWWFRSTVDNNALRIWRGWNSFSRLPPQCQNCQAVWKRKNDDDLLRAGDSKQSKTVSDMGELCLIRWIHRKKTQPRLLLIFRHLFATLDLEVPNKN